MKVKTYLFTLCYLFRYLISKRYFFSEWDEVCKKEVLEKEVEENKETSKTDQISSLIDAALEQGDGTAVMDFNVHKPYLIVPNLSL